MKEEISRCSVGGAEGLGAEAAHMGAGSGIVKQRSGKEKPTYPSCNVRQAMTVIICLESGRERQEGKEEKEGV